MSSEKTPEEETLEKIKLVLSMGNDAQAIRLLEQYGSFMQEGVYTQEEVRGMIIKFWEQFPDKWDIDTWFNENKKV